MSLKAIASTNNGCDNGAAGYSEFTIMYVTTEYTGQMNTAEEPTAAQQSVSIVPHECCLLLVVEVLSLMSVCRSRTHANISNGIGDCIYLNTASENKRRSESIIATTASQGTQHYRLGPSRNVAILVPAMRGVNTSAWSIGRVRYNHVDLGSMFIFAAISNAVQISVYCYSFINYLEVSLSILGGSISAIIGCVDQYYRKARIGVSLGTCFSDALHGVCGIYITSLVR